MATFRVNKLWGQGSIESVCIQKKWWNPWSWKSYAWRAPGFGGTAYVMVGDTMVRKLVGKVDGGKGWVFDADAPDGTPWVICEDGAVCEVERLD